MIAAMLGQSALDLDGTRDGLLRTVEAGKQPVADMLDLFATILANQPLQHLIMPAQYLVPGIVAHRPHELGGLDDVREDECAGRLRARRLIGTACDPKLHSGAAS